LAEEKKTPTTMKVILKCNYSLKGKDGIEKKKPDETVTLPYGEAQRLIDIAWAIKA